MLSKPRLGRFCKDSIPVSISVFNSIPKTISRVPSQPLFLTLPPFAPAVPPAAAAAAGAGRRLAGGEPCAPPQDWVPEPPRAQPLFVVPSRPRFLEQVVAAIGPLPVFLIGRGDPKASGMPKISAGAAVLSGGPVRGDWRPVPSSPRDVTS
ncbi:hypothetical protein LZ32DRAFT_39695 [Colletotrichum eremochloae]|nr:hypothetical protein LZ32DRAFT_39695 [Colletotrichum eremochloae]